LVIEAELGGRFESALIAVGRAGHHHHRAPGGDAQPAELSRRSNHAEVGFDGTLEPHRFLDERGNEARFVAQRDL
jgi:hypothetical protein